MSSAMLVKEGRGTLADSDSLHSRTVLVADRQPMIQWAVTRFLEENGAMVIAHAARGKEALALAHEEPPAVAVVDPFEPGLDGLELLRGLAAPPTPIPVIVYTESGDRDRVVSALAAGARGFVLKEAPLEDLVRAIEAVELGQVFVDPSLAGLLASPAAGGPARLLTPREREVLQLVAEGLRRGEIGEKLSISRETVSTHLRHVMRKLGGRNTPQSVAIALRRSLIA